MEGWEHILLTKQRNDLKGFTDIITETKKRSFPDLIKLRPMESHEEHYHDLANTPLTFALTITYQPWNILYDDEQMRDIITKAINFFPNKGYIFYPDIDNGGNRHYHGIISMAIKDYSKLKRYFTLTIGFVKKEYLSNPYGWYTYMRKNIGFKSREHPIALTSPIYDGNDLQKLIITSQQ